MDHAPEEAAVIIDMEPVASTSAAGMGQIATSQVNNNPCGSEPKFKWVKI